MTTTTLKARDAWMKALLASGEHDTVKLIGVRMALYLNIRSGRCDPSYNGMARDIGLITKRRKDTAMRATKTLEAHGWISVVRAVGRGRTNSFVLLPPPKKAASRSDLLGEEKAASECGLFNDEKGRIRSPEKAASDDRKGRKSPPEKAAPGCGPNREYEQRILEQRERALTRAPLSSEPNFENSKVEILPPAKPSQGRGKPTPLPADWQPDDDDWTYATRHGLTADDIDTEAQAFRDWHAVNPKPSADWAASWRRWVSNSRANPRNRRESGGDRARRLAATIRAGEERAAARAGGPAAEPNVWVSRDAQPDLWRALAAVRGREAPTDKSNGWYFAAAEIRAAEAQIPRRPP